MDHNLLWISYISLNTIKSWLDHSTVYITALMFIALKWVHSLSNSNNRCSIWWRTVPEEIDFLTFLYHNLIYRCTFQMFIKTSLCVLSKIFLTDVPTYALYDLRSTSSVGTNTHLDFNLLFFYRVLQVVQSEIVASKANPIVSSHFFCTSHCIPYSEPQLHRPI